jgi:hypothetical protein
MLIVRVSFLSGAGLLCAALFTAAQDIPLWQESGWGGV